jgi:ubiquinone/menaquinone biosynthesis C-methylase UbiE
MLKNQYKNIFQNQDNHWWYRSMRLINESLLNRYLPKNKSLKILDAGCGPGAALIYLAKYGEVTGVDISEEALKFAGKRGKVKKGSISDLPFKDNEFDVVVCLDVLYHKLVNINKAISEMERVLKPGGVIFIREPAFNWLQSSEDIASQTNHRFTTDELKKKLDRSFKFCKLSYINFFLFPLALLKRIPEVIGLKEKKGISDIQAAPPILNKLLFLVFQSEKYLLNYTNFPFGTSVICIAKKKNISGKNSV